ncbi:MAG: hypothetical protein VYA80_08005 [Pseudomonadota bacterium]|nr:hypothetical protein [Pseudomonadota bacterium]
MIKKKFHPSILLVWGFLSFGCSAYVPPDTKSQAPINQSNKIETSQSRNTDSPEKRARKLVAKNLKIKFEQTEVLSSKKMDFPDSSLGCPKPNTFYAQIIRYGHQIMIKAKNNKYDVRIAGTQSIICDQIKG